MRLPTTVSPRQSAGETGAIISSMASTPIKNEAHLAGATSEPYDDGKPQTSSLVGFDPFLPDSLSATAPKTVIKKKVAPISMPEAPATPDEHRDGAAGTRADLQKLQKELRAIASQLERESPRKRDDSLLVEGKQPQNVGPPSPIRRGLRARSSASSTNTPTTQGRTLFHPFSKKLGHRKADSLAENTRLWKEVNEAEAAVGRPNRIQKRSASTSAMTGVSMSKEPPVGALQEVWDGMKRRDSQSPNSVADTSEERLESLYIPNLAKPRPTSFLTGRDVVRSSEYDATQWQLEIPEKKEFQVSTKAAQFLDTYRSKECLLDLHSLVGYSRPQLAQFASGAKPSPVTKIADCHRPIVESLLDCGDDIVEVRGYIHNHAADLEQRREVLILERQRQFLVVIRGNAAEQQGKYNKQPETIALKEGHDVTVFADIFHAVRELEDAMFARLDELAEATPFCDVVFCGHSFGASMATLAAYLYAYTRSDQRVAALVTCSPKVGLMDFRWSVHSSPNLKVMRLECGSGSNPRGGHGSSQHQSRHVGHTLRISPKQQEIKAYKFSPGPVESKVRSRLFKRDRDISDCVQALDELSVWVKDYHKEDGAGVRGKDNETRHMV